MSNLKKEHMENCRFRECLLLVTSASQSDRSLLVEKTKKITSFIMKRFDFTSSHFQPHSQHATFYDMLVQFFSNYGKSKPFLRLFSAPL